ncbi:MAG: protease SohB [Granulosicoccus sp.]
MAEFIYEYGLFFLKALTFVVAVVAIIVAIVAAASRSKSAGGASSEGHIEIKKYNERLEDLHDALSFSLLNPAEQKEAEKEKKAERKAEKKAEKAAAKIAKKQRGSGETIVPETKKSRLYVLDFDGDIRASEVEKLRREITAVLTAATTEDEIVVRLESGGGMVTSYGLAASQLDRIRDKKIPLTICVDKVAASGGYMMACVADKLVAAPFAVLGSIGVVAQIPNFHRLLKELKIDFELLTAGKYKRTLTVFGENTDEAREKFLEDIERIHVQFKSYVGERRPQLDIDKVATGEIWSGQDTLDLHLVDKLSTSDQYLIDACEEREVLILSYKEKKSLADRLSLGVQNTVDSVLLKWINRLANSRYSIG